MLNETQIEQAENLLGYCEQHGESMAHGSNAAHRVATAAELLREKGRGVTGCNYGCHPFVHQPAAQAPEGMHLHVCPDCDATYFDRGAGPCYACAPASTKEYR